MVDLACAREVSALVPDLELSVLTPAGLGVLQHVARSHSRVVW